MAKATKKIELWPPGTRVSINGQVYDAEIVEVVLRGDPLNVEYQVAWWDGHTRLMQRFRPEQIGAYEQEPDVPQLAIGFHAREQ